MFRIVSGAITYLMQVSAGCNSSYEHPAVAPIASTVETAHQGGKAVVAAVAVTTLAGTGSNPRRSGGILALLITGPLRKKSPRFMCVLRPVRRLVSFK